MGSLPWLMLALAGLSAMIGGGLVAPALRWSWARLHGEERTARSTDLLIAGFVTAIVGGLLSAGGAPAIPVAAPIAAGLAPALILGLRPVGAVRPRAPPHAPDLEGFTLTLAPRPAWPTLLLLTTAPVILLPAVALGGLWSALGPPALTLTVRGSELRWARGRRGGRVDLSGAVVREEEAWDGSARLALHHRGGTLRLPLGGLPPGQPARIAARLRQVAARPAPSPAPAPPRALRALRDRPAAERC